MAERGPYIDSSYWEPPDVSDALLEAYDAGASARQRGAGSLPNPYPKGSAEAQEFFRGWVVTNAREAAGYSASSGDRAEPGQEGGPS